MLMQTDGPPKDWKNNVELVVQMGKFLSLRRGGMTPEGFVKYVRAAIEIDISSAMKLIKIAEHPILSNPEYYDRLPPAWGLLYELRFLPDETIMEGIRSNTLAGASKYTIWELRGVKHNRPVNRNNVAVPEGTTLVELCRSGLKIEQETKKTPEEIAPILGIGKQTYRLVRTIILLSQRPELSEAEIDLIEKTFDKINKTRNVRTYYKDVKPLIDRVWGDNRNKTYDNKSARKRIDAFRSAVTIVYDTCERASLIEQPLMPIADIDAAINELTNARKIIAQITENLRRARND